jgi:hypothetical protein
MDADQLEAAADQAIAACSGDAREAGQGAELTLGLNCSGERAKITAVLRYGPAHHVV